ncbi:hypothetical protein [Kitasatospora sp. NPDC058478]|uniref:hypothetical protein n=1 Tax=unclassified Kitasatospora TaxID=2633591 RepID=UPI00364AF1A9
MPLTATERAHLDSLIRRAAYALTPTEQDRLLRLWEHDQADRAQEKRSAGGAAAALRRTQAGRPAPGGPAPA